MKRNASRAPAIITLGYAIIGFLYIALSDRALVLLTLNNLELYQILQTWKGWGFILVTALLLWLALRYAVREITGRMNATLQSERRLRLALEAAGGAVWTARREEGNISLLAAGALTSELGLDTKEPLPIAVIQDGVHPEDRAAFASLISPEENPSSGIADQLIRIRDKRDEYRWLKIVAEQFDKRVTKGNQRTTIGVALDVSWPIEISERLNDAIRGGELGIWRLNLLTNGVEVNEVWANMLGYSVNELSPFDLAKFHDLLHPEDSMKLKDVHTTTLAANQSEFSNELRLRHKGGHWVWVLSRGRITRSSTLGVPQVVSGVHIDITSRKHLEKALLSERDFLLRLTETSISGILGLDESGVIRFANAEAERLLGSSLESMLQQRTSLEDWDARLLSGVLLNAEEMPLNRILAGEQIIHGLRMSIMRPDGARSSISLNAASVLAEGSPIRIVFSLTDISSELVAQRALEQAAKSARHDAQHDSLTGLPNREYFRERLKLAVESKSGRERPIFLVFLDIDNFKLVNDARGHLAGDDILIEVSRRLSATLPSAALMARIGGDEFTIMFELADISQSEPILSSIASAFEQPFSQSSDEIWLTCSMGVSIAPLDADSPDDMMRNADVAMYHAKGKGRNQIQVFSSELRHQMKREGEISQALRRSLDERSFYLALQPRFSLTSGFHLVGAEALIRASNADLAVCGPQEFIPIAERTGLARQIDLHVISMLGSILAINRISKVHHDLQYSLNISAESLKCDGFGTAIVERLSEAGLTPRQVLLEVTETAMMAESSVLKANIRSILAAGYEFSIDDFGTGFSSLSRLQQLPLREIKVDRSFIGRLGVADRPSDTVVRAILAMAQALSLRTVAEGVETTLQANWLRDHGCDFVQGFLYSAPLDVEAFAELVDRT